jgi:hypothetical protein
MFHLKIQTQGYWLNINNAISENDALSLQKIEEVKFIRLSEPYYSHDLPHCDFFLFRYLKKKLEEKNFRCENEVISAVTTIWKRSRFECFPKCLNNKSRNCTSILQMRNVCLTIRYQKVCAMQDNSLSLESIRDSMIPSAGELIPHLWHIFSCAKLCHYLQEKSFKNNLHFR